MAIRKIAHRPDLTKEQAEEIFRRNFEPRYKVQHCEAPLSLKTKFRDFQVVKNQAVGGALKLEQTAPETRFVYGGVPPYRWLRSATFGLVSIVCLAFAGDLTREIEEFIDSAPEFR